MIVLHTHSRIWSGIKGTIYARFENSWNTQAIKFTFVDTMFFFFLLLLASLDSPAKMNRTLKHKINRDHNYRRKELRAPIGIRMI